MQITLRVLIVDDDPTVRLTLGRVIGRQRDMTSVGEAVDGRTALREIRRQAPDVIVMDVGLPDVSGIDVAHRLRAHGDTTPVLFLTGDATAVERAAGIDRTCIVLKAGGQLGEMLEALRQVSGVPSIAESTARAPAGLRRNASITLRPSSGRGSPEIRTMRTPRPSG